MPGKCCIDHFGIVYNPDMEHLPLTDQQKQALAANHGCVQGDDFILMSIDVFRETMGVGTEEALAESLKAIEEGHADVEAGRTRPYLDVLADLGKGRKTDHPSNR